MKKIVYVILTFTTLLLALGSCRKGAEDPFLSLRSRQSRLIGVWEISGIEGTRVDTRVKLTGGTSTKKITTTFKDTLKKSFDGTTAIDSVYSEVLSINEDGTFNDTINSKKFVENAVNSKKTNTRIVTNQWHWLNTKKNKTGIELVGLGSFNVDRLASKELVLSSYKMTVKASDKDSQTSEETITITYKRRN